MNRILPLFGLASLCCAPVSDAELIARTGFEGRTFATVTTTNDTATGLSWTTIGIADPGDLTVVPDLPLANGFAEFELDGLFDTPSTANAFVPNLNIHNEGSYYVDVPIDVTAADGLSLETLTITGLIRTNLGAPQGVGREVDYAVEVLDFEGEVLASDAVAGQDAFQNEGATQPAIVTLDLGDIALGDGESATVRLYVGADGVLLGNNAGFDDLLIEGTPGGPPADPRLSAPFAFDLGRVLAFPATTEFAIPVSNTGSAQPLTITEVELGGTDAASFEVASFPASLDAGADGEIVVRLDTTGVELADFSAVLFITSDDAFLPGQEIALAASIDAPLGDSDGDGLSDEAEQGESTDALDPDSDDDGLSDGEEVNTLGTDPNDADTDGDGFGDAEEVAEGTDPLDENSFPELRSIIAATNFDGRTLTTTTSNNDTATGLVWTVNGVSDPGDLVAVPDQALGNGFAQFQANGLFATAPAANAFVPDLNIHNEGTYYVDVPLNTEAQVTVDRVSLTAQIHNNAGALQGVGREVDYTVTLLDAEGGVLAEDAVSGQDAIAHNGAPAPVTVEFDLGGTVLPGGTANVLRISVGADGTLVGNNAGFDDLEITGPVGPGTPFAITSITPDPENNTVTITWNSLPGREYSIDFSEDLEEWPEITDAFPSEGESTSFTDTTLPKGGAPTRFYRVRLDP